MIQTSGILTLTLNPALDCSSEAETVWPVRKVRTFNETYVAGGGGINVARAITQLGGEATALYFAGGATGVFLGELLDAATVPHVAVQIKGNTRISHNVFDRATRQDFRFVPDGPEVSKAEIDALLAKLETLSPRWIIGSGSLPRGATIDIYAKVADIAKAKGAHFVLDTSGLALKAALAHGGLSLIKPSLGELASIGGVPLNTREEQEAAALALVRSGAAERVAVTLGKDGGFLADNGGIFGAPAPSVEALSAVGAGDSFLGAMVLSLAQGATSREAFLTGMAAGAAACLTIGTQLCHKTDVDRILATIKAQIS
ncbi:MAG: 1-phosphofructokinase family hexose kinase [Rhizobiaceae bacterium]